MLFYPGRGLLHPPTLVGGRTGQMISNFIACRMQTSLNWGLAPAIANMQLVVVLLMYWVHGLFVDITNWKLDCSQRR